MHCDHKKIVRRHIVYNKSNPFPAHSSLLLFTSVKIKAINIPVAKLPKCPKKSTSGIIEIRNRYPTIQINYFLALPSLTVPLTIRYIRINANPIPAQIAVEAPILTTYTLPVKYLRAKQEAIFPKYYDDYLEFLQKIEQRNTPYY
eukprot:GHVR01086887.1.p1 GENE.GHVR01086887.1~~GHVR01086887.1.p1  ORF type:complete len:145 (+),score=0.86 GHVR01086887.1:1703-2137(+)